MPQFTDTAGRAWEIVIHVSAVRSVRAALGIDLSAAFDKKAAVYKEITGDVVKLINVMYVLCRAQADARKITDEQFGQAISGDCIEAIRDAFTEELVDFFPNGQLRQAIRRMLAAAKAAREMLVAELARLEIDASAVAKILNPAFTGSSGPSAAASIPVPLHSGSLCGWRRGLIWLGGRIHRR